MATGNPLLFGLQEGIRSLEDISIEASLVVLATVEAALYSKQVVGGSFY
jgi:hypothetical protein